MERDDQDHRMLRAELELTRRSLQVAEQAARVAEEERRHKDELLCTLSGELRARLAALVEQTTLLCQGRHDHDAAASQALELLARDALLRQRRIDDVLDAPRAGPGATGARSRSLPVRPFSAPVADGAPCAPDGPPPPSARERRLSRLSVLIVEDEPDSRELIELLLSSEGATVRSAGSALAALALLEEATPDIVLSDIGMPGRDGYWLAREVRKRHPDIAAIALTAFSAQEDIEHALAAGFDHHVGKPVDPEQLVRALRACLPARPQRGARPAT